MWVASRRYVQSVVSDEAPLMLPPARPLLLRPATSGKELPKTSCEPE